MRFLILLAVVASAFASLLQAVFTYKVFFLVSIYATQTTIKKPAQFTYSDFVEATFSAISPLVSAATSYSCDLLKNMFGLTYNQMLEKNMSEYFDLLTIDVITDSGQKKYSLNDTEQIYRRLLNSERIAILIHGFLESSDGLMVQGVAPALLKQPGLKVLALDGRKTISVEYFRSSTYARFMGERLGFLLTDLIKRGQSPSTIMLIGHSLGAHIAGIAGKTVLNNTGKLLGRISALDPAGPCFTNADEMHRLSRHDAAFVDVIHTNAGVLGFALPVGHLDFYPNGGQNQAGCRLPDCDHSRAWEYFAESVNAVNHFPARLCSSWNDYVKGACSDKKITYMGWNANSFDTGLYYLTTAPSAPYGLGAAGSV